MHEVACTHCGQVLQISPDAPRCSRCGEDLHALIPPHRAANYFYRRSAELAARGDLPSALAEAERGLDFVEATELRLLAAILSKRQGDMETVRAHVSAIPVDDRLRQEAEWLIRSQSGRNQSSQPSEGGEANRRVPAGRSPSRPDPQPTAQAADAARAQGAPSPATSPAQRPVTQAAAPAPVSAGGQRPPAQKGALWAQRLWGIVALVMLVIAGAMGWTLLSGGPDALLALVPGLVEESSPRGLPRDALQPVTPAPLILPTATIQGLPALSSNVVLAVTPEPYVEDVADTPPLQSAPFDLATVLEAAGRSDLLGLPLEANVDGDRVRLTGTVTNTTVRQDVIELVQGVSGVRDVDVANLQVHVPATYTVQAGDSLWSIADRFYGSDATSVAALYETNRDVLPSAQALQVGMILHLPPAQ